MGEVGDENRRGRGGERTVQKSYFDVLGICCPSEVPLVEKILKPIDGVLKVSVVVPSKTVIVEHDPLLISQLQLVKALNQARLEATIRAYGTEKILNKWPSPYIIACGFFLLVSLLGRFFHPLRWLAIVAVAVGLPPIVLRSFAAVRRITLDINILMLIAVGGAIALRDFSEAGFIVFLFTVAEWLETRASHKATAGMSALMSMAPQKAVLAETGEVVDAQDVKVNTLLAVKAGEVIPIDGTVVQGKSEVNEQSLTGESFPVPKQAQSLVWAGTLNIDGYISVKTTALSEDSAVAKMARLVEEAQNSRSKTQRLIDSCTKYYTPVVVMIAGCVAVVPLILRVHNPKHWFQLALVILVSACPCALVLSTPVATFCSLLKAARIGLLIKGGDVLEALARTRVVAFDKTGTITKGEFTIMELRAIGSQVTMNTLLYWISSIESKSSHPMASALVDHARLKSVEPKSDNVCEFQIYPGEGVYGEIDGNKIFIGNRRIAARAGCDSVPEDVMDESVTQGYVFLGAELIGTFTLSDSCRTGAAEAITELKSLGLKTVILTGDSNAAAMHAQNQLGHAIDVVHAELLPEDKVRIINELKTKEGPTTMIGDGMNDAPALAAANVGMAMGISGSAVAMETSHITLMSNDILKIPRAIRLARRTHRKIIANIIFSVITKVAILALAVAGHPLLWAAVLADVGTCLVVILNSMMLLRTKSAKAKKHHCSSSSHASGAHKHSRAGHSSTNHDQYCQDLEGRRRHSETEEHHECNGSVNCSGDAHTHAPAHEDQCSHSLHRQSPDHKHCCEEAGVPAHEDQCSHSLHRQSPDHKHCCEEAGGEHNAAVDCGTEHHCNSTHKAEDHAKHAHVHCDVVHTGCDENHRHVANHEEVGSCSAGACSSSLQSTVTSSQHAIFIGCEEETHVEIHEETATGVGGCGHHGGDAAKHCDNHRSRTKQREIGQCCRTGTMENRKKDCCPSAARTRLGKRAAGGCCRSYRRECGKREGCCGGGIAHLPEIIIE